MFKPSVGYVLMAGVLSFAFINAASAEPFNADLSRQYMSGDKAAYLAGVHTKKGLDCAACHTTNVISDSETEINKQCAICHGSLEQMGTKTSSQTPNPHKSHIGQMQCTACHSGHVPSVAYCTNCHDFPTLNKMKQGVSRLKAKFTDDLSKYEELKPVKIEKTDLLIVGSGAAGFTASMAAREAGVKNLIMIEKMAVPGGNSQLAAGGMNAAGTKFQKQAGIEDNPQLMFDDTMKGGKNVSNPDLVRVLADKSNESIEWLDKHGATLSHVGQGGGSSAARMHGPADGAFVGPYLSKFFRDAAAKSNLDLRLNTKLVKLIKGTNGEITGALVKGKHTGIYQIDAKAVILATGGIGANPELIQKLRPDISPEVKTSNQPGSQGDGIILGENVGAAVVDAKEIQLNPTLLVGSPVIVSETVRGAGAVFVNKEGKRFISELTTRDKTSAAVSKQTGGVAYEIFDQKVRDKVKQTGAAFELGLAKEGRTLEELGKNAGIDPKNLAATIAQYNKYAEAGNDPEFGRPKISAKVDTPNFYAIEVTPAIHYYMGGLKINPQAKVIDKNGKVIEGLFAAGEVTGGVHGKNRLGGNSISETITFGRISGEEAAKRIANN
ncbi:flavocytochrome c [Parasutterella sp.]|uniref:flavocytochrome c n=1 Tax=Parasutterella sp. TaxID=2049037 RepID=UPI0039A3F439